VGYFTDLHALLAPQQRLVSLQNDGRLVMFPNDNLCASDGSSVVSLHLEHLMCTIGTTLIQKCEAMVTMGQENNPYVMLSARARVCVFVGFDVGLLLACDPFDLLHPWCAMCPQKRRVAHTS